MIQDSGAKNWSTHTWYQVGTDLGAGASAMIFDADILGYFMNGGDNKEAGNIGYAPFAANPNASAPTPNVWIGLWQCRVSRSRKMPPGTSFSGLLLRIMECSGRGRWTS